MLNKRSCREGADGHHWGLQEWRNFRNSTRPDSADKSFFAEQPDNKMGIRLAGHKRFAISCEAAAPQRRMELLDGWRMERRRIRKFGWAVVASFFRRFTLTPVKTPG